MYEIAIVSKVASFNYDAWKYGSTDGKKYKSKLKATNQAAKMNKEKGYEYGDRFKPFYHVIESF
jgi:hypothetical protein